MSTAPKIAELLETAELLKIAEATISEFVGSCSNCRKRNATHIFSKVVWVEKAADGKHATPIYGKYQDVCYPCFVSLAQEYIQKVKRDI